MFNLSGKIALVPGGTGLLGKEIVRALSKAGSKVYLGSRNELKAKSVIDTLRYEGLDIYPLVFDVSSLESVRGAVNDLSKKETKLDILVNAVRNRDAIYKSVENTTTDDWLDYIKVDLIGTFLCSQQFHKMLIKSSSSSIINIASIYGINAVDTRIYEGTNLAKPTPITYAASKAAIINITKYLAVYWRKDNIRVNVITPGGIFNDQPREFVNAYSHNVPIGRMGMPGDVNGAVVFLASDEASYITGQNIVVDGGWTIW